MSSAFQLLSRGGSSFDKQKFKREHEMFAKKDVSIKSRHSKGSSKKSVAAIPNQTLHLPSELDFFAQSAASPKSRPQPSSSNNSAIAASIKKRRRVKEEFLSDSDPDENAVPTAGPSRPPLPAPPKQKITLSGPSPLPTSFISLDDLLPPSHANAYLHRNLAASGVHEIWGVQGAVSGCALSNEERDGLVVAPTGSGKTLAYLLPLFRRLRSPCRQILKESKRDDAEGSGSNGQGIRSVIVLPTHELALQTQNEIAKLIKDGPGWRCILLDKATERSVVDAAPGKRVDEGEKGEEDAEGSKGEKGKLGIDFLVATPERLHHLVSENRIDLSHTRHLTLDEADRLIGPDFYDQVAPIVSACTHPKLQKNFLSATMEAGPEALAREWLRDGGVRIVVGKKDAATSTISQYLQFCGHESGKLMALRNDIAAGKITPPTLIFVQSIERANDLFRELVLDGLQVGVIHSERSKAMREETVKDFREGKVWILVVTELMARGLDFKGVEVVVNYDFPQTVQSYVHRIGRTGRAGRRGTAITYFSLEDGPYLRTIANVLKASSCPVEPWMLDLPAPSKNTKKALKRKPVERKAIGGQKGKNVGRGEALSRKQMVEASRKRAERGGRGKEPVRATGGSQRDLLIKENLV